VSSPTATARAIIEQVAGVLRGKDEVVELAVTALLAGGHVLVEDVPGVGKTTLARALAASLGLSFRRVQFTSDLMPADVLGGNVFDREANTFTFRRGPVFTQVLLADEINRTTPKTQSALLEAMGERQVSIDGETHALERPFFVMATQNPRDFYGTYPLPESQLDRFLVRIRIGYPAREVERQVIAQRRQHDPIEHLAPVVDQSALDTAQRALDSVKVDDSVLDYLHDVVVGTREHELLELGASTRAAIAFDRAIRAYALVQGRDYATPDDVKHLAQPVLAHRVRPAGARDGHTARADAERVLGDLLGKLRVPV